MEAAFFFKVGCCGGGLVSVGIVAAVIFVEWLLKLDLFSGKITLIDFFLPWRGGFFSLNTTQSFVVS